MLREYQIDDLYYKETCKLRRGLCPGDVVGRRSKVGARVKLDHESWGVVVSIDRDEYTATVFWSIAPEWEQKLNFSKFATPLIRRVYTPSLANSLISIQPLPMPSGGIFYADNAFPEVSGSV